MPTDNISEGVAPSVDVKDISGAASAESKSLTQIAVGELSPGSQPDERPGDSAEASKEPPAEFHQLMDALNLGPEAREEYMAALSQGRLSSAQRDTLRAQGFSDDAIRVLQNLNNPPGLVRALPLGEYPIGQPLPSIGEMFRRSVSDGAYTEALRTGSLSPELEEHLSEQGFGGFAIRSMQGYAQLVARLNSPLE